MKYYKLMTDTTLFFSGGIFTFQAKHLLMSKLSFEEQRSVLWEETTEAEAKANPQNVVTPMDVHGDDGERNVFHGPDGQTYYN